MSGEVIPITEVKDALFSTKALGDGIAIKPTNDRITAPCAGTISAVMEGSCHAVGMTLGNGAELLIHEGIDTVEMNGEGFELYVKIGDKVKAEDNLIKFDRDLIVQKGYQNTCIVVLTNADEYPDAQFISGMDAVQDETIVIKF